MDKDQFVDLRIEKLVTGGAGLARHEGIVYFVPFSAPGDFLRCRIIEIKSNHRRAEIVEVLEPSTDRTSAPCDVFGVCGGCQWQHIKSDVQVKAKDLLVREHLREFITSDVDVRPIVESPKNWAYRNRCQIKVSGGRAGFYKAKSHDVVQPKKCWVLEEPLEEARLQFTAKAAQFEKQSPEWELAMAESGSIIQLPRNSVSDETGFSQINRSANELLVKTVLDWASEKNFSRILDFYAGHGNFSFPLNDRFRKAPLIAVEMSSGSVKKAKEKMTALQLKPHQVEFYMAAVEVFLRRFAVQPEDLVILDPPRMGLHKDVVQSLATSPAHRFIQISCNPSALERDLRLWKSLNPSLKIKRVQAFDLFPHTSHVEVLIEWEQTPIC